MVAQLLTECPCTATNNTTSTTSTDMLLREGMPNVQYSDYLEFLSLIVPLGAAPPINNIVEQSHGHGMLHIKGRSHSLMGAEKGRTKECFD